MVETILFNKNGYLIGGFVVGEDRRCQIISYEYIKDKGISVIEGYRT